MRLEFFYSNQRQKGTAILSNGIKYSMGDLISGVNWCVEAAKLRYASKK